MTVKHTLVSSDMRVFALCSLMELHRSKNTIFPFFLISWFNTTQILWTFDFLL